MELPAYNVKPIPEPKPLKSYGKPVDAKLAIRNCPEGKSFTVDTAACRRRVLDAASVLGIRVRTKKNEDGRYDCWRIK